MLLVLVYIVSSLWDLKRFSLNLVKNLLKIYHEISEITVMLLLVVDHINIQNGLLDSF